MHHAYHAQSRMRADRQLYETRLAEIVARQQVAETGAFDWI